jgi:hypothetical protein
LEIAGFFTGARAYMRTLSKFYVVATFIISLASACAVSAQFPADVEGWQEARWGMTEAELVTAFKSKLVKRSEREMLVDNKGYADYIIPDYEIEGNKFTVFFDMDMQTKKLMRVRMSLTDGKSILPNDSGYFSPYEALLARKFGRPTFQSDERKKAMVTLKRQWTYKTTTIELLYVWAYMGNINWSRIEYYPSKGGDVNKI